MIGGCRLPLRADTRTISLAIDQTGEERWDGTTQGRQLSHDLGDQPSQPAMGRVLRPGRSPKIAAVHFDMVAIAADGNKVLTERVDRFVRADGSEVAAIRLRGIFEVDGNHIAAWRDYADVNTGKKIGREPA